MNHRVISMIISSDWHLGTIPIKRFRDELFTLVKEAIHITHQLDLFVVAGDIFDMKEYFTSDAVKGFLYIMIDLLRLTKDYHTQFRFLEGTRTHDAMQLDTLQIIFEKLMERGDIKFIQEVTSERLFNMDILYIPEEYISDSETYYKDYFNQHYDLLFGHGNTSMMWYMNEDSTSYSSAPVFQVDDLCRIANYAYFGHFHYNKADGENNRFKSIGPVTRWEFGKEDRCGLYHAVYDADTELAAETYLENHMAQIFKTIEINITKNYDLKQLDELIFHKLYEVENYADRVRLIINIDTQLDNYITMKDAITATYNNYPKVTLIINPTGAKTKVDTTKTTEEIIKEKPYLYNKSMNDEERIASHIKTKKGVNIPIEYITEVIKKPNNQKGQLQ